MGGGGRVAKNKRLYNVEPRLFHVEDEQCRHLGAAVKPCDSDRASSRYSFLLTREPFHILTSPFSEVLTAHIAASLQSPCFKPRL